MENYYYIDNIDTPTIEPGHEDIADPEHMYSTWKPEDFAPGKTSTYLIMDTEFLWEIVTLEIWDKRPVSLQMYKAYVADVKQLYG